MSSQLAYSQLTQASTSSRATLGTSGGASISRRLDGISHRIPPSSSAASPAEFILLSTFRLDQTIFSSSERSRSRETATPAPSAPPSSVFRTPSSSDRASRDLSVTPQKRKPGFQENDGPGREASGVWTVRIVQRLLKGGDEGGGHQAVYERCWEDEELSELAEKQGYSSWTLLAGAILAALLPDGAGDGPAVDIQWSKRHQRDDGTCEKIKLGIHLPAQSGKASGAELGLKLDRVPSERELAATSDMVHELVAMNARLRAEAARMHQEQVKNRKLIHNGRKHEIAKEANSSLSNPGRIKRQTEDTEGFEGDD